MPAILGPSPSRTRGIDVAVIAAFVLATVVPGVLGIAAVARAPLPPPAAGGGTARSRTLAWAGVARTAFEERFGFRRALIRWHSRLKLQLFGVSPSPTVLVGRDGWFFYADDGALEDYVSATPFTEEELIGWQHTLEHTRDWLKARGVAYLFVVAPDKHAIYPQYMPGTVHPLHSPSRAEQFVAWMRAQSDVEVLDLRSPLAARASVERVYHKTDSHWNDRGALVAYEEIEQRLARRVPGLAPTPADRFTPTERDGPGQDLARMLGLEDVLGERMLGVRPQTPRVARVVEPASYDPGFGEARVVTARPGGGPTAVVFRDSFGSALVPFLAEDFGRAVFLWQKDFDPAPVLEERPQVVIHEIASRFFAVHWPYDAVAEGKLGGAGARPGR